MRTYLKDELYLPDRLPVADQPPGSPKVGAPEGGPGRLARSTGAAAPPQHSRSPRQTPKAVEERVVQLRKQTGFGRERPSHQLMIRAGADSPLPPTPSASSCAMLAWLVQPRKRRKVCYPAHWAWQTSQKSLSLSPKTSKRSATRLPWAPGSSIPSPPPGQAPSLVTGGPSWRGERA